MLHLRDLPILLGVGLLIVTSPAHAEAYRIQSGDVLNFAILGANNIDQRITVDLDGQVRVPVGGSFKAAGLTVEELHEEIVSKLKSGSFPLGTDANGRTVWDAIFPQAITLNIAEYRPVFVSGDVLNPGMQPFRSGTTVRQVLAVAGGASPFRSQQDPTLELLGSAEQYRSLLAQQIGVQLTTERVRAELASEPEPTFSNIPDNGLAASERTELEQTERATFEARTRDLSQEQATINQGIQSIEVRRGLLIKSQANLEGETKIYEDELKRSEGLYAKGLVQVSRLNDARRALFLVSTRSLDTSAEVARLERELVEMRQSLEKSVSDQKAENLKAMKTATLELASVKASLERLSQRMKFLSPRDQLPTIKIVRTENGSAATIAAALDMPVRPGDTLLVKLNDTPGEETADGGSSAAADPDAKAQRSSPRPENHAAE